MASTHLAVAPAHRFASRLAAAARHAKREGIPSHLLAHAEQAFRDVAAFIKIKKDTSAAANGSTDRLASAPPRTQHLADLLAGLAGGAPESTLHLRCRPPWRAAATGPHQCPNADVF